MGLSLLRRLAASAPAPAIVLPGGGAAAVAHRLRVDAAVEIVDSPRHATVLVALGDLPGLLGAAAAQVHDQLPAPRGVVWVPVGADDVAPPIPGLCELEADQLGAAVASLHRDVVTGARGSTVDALPDVEPNEWRGIGPYGQGGKGMTGGVPYGRPLTGRAPDRDGLELDQLVLRLGPWLPVLPPGLLLDVRVQGDVIQEASVAENPFRRPPLPDVFGRALTEPVRIAELERTRAAHHLRWAAGVARLIGLGALGARLDGAAVGLDDRAAALAARLAGDRRFRPPMKGIGVVHRQAAGMIGGPVGRAAGAALDARGDDPAYRALGFEPVVAEGSDAWARWRVRLAEADRSLRLAGAAGEARTTPAGLVESPRGPIGGGRPPPSTALLDLFGDLLAGREWGDAAVAVASLDVDVEEAAVGPRVPS